MKHFSKMVLALVLSIIMATLLPVQVYADKPDYISEIKIGMGNSASEAKAALDGYTILDCDLNQNAGSTSYGAKGNKAVYLGYKTTKVRDEAVTDIALMNMKGGYDLDNYEFLMEHQLKEQIIPFVDEFLTAINEYRANYKSKSKHNRERAIYVNNMLNKLTDDDCGGAKLGNLLLNETKYEMGDEAYNKLSDEEKKKHCDIVTLFAQASGHATLLIESLITRAADTSTNTTWLGRFSETTYDDLIAATGKSPTDARKYLAKQYDDGANLLLNRVEEFREDLLNYNEALEFVKDCDIDSVIDFIEEFNEFDVDEADPDEVEEMLERYEEAQETLTKFFSSSETVTIYEYLKSIEYMDGTMLDFFLQTKDEFENDITMLYPLVASFSEGQRAGMEFLSLKEFMSIVLTESNKFKEVTLENTDEASVYEGVDRRIYEKGGVAITSDALREKALSQTEEEREKGLSNVSKILIALASVTSAAFLVSLVPSIVLSKSAASWRAMAKVALENFNRPALPLIKEVNPNSIFAPAFEDSVSESLSRSFENIEYQAECCDAKLMKYLDLETQTFSPGQYKVCTEKAASIATAKSVTARFITTGLAIAAVVLIVFSISSSLNDMKAYYKVDYTPIPRFIVDEKDLIGYNSKGEKIVLKNQTAYYQAAECNRSEKAEYYNAVGNLNDLNGDVGKQWLSLYYAKHDVEEPILASSLNVVVGNNNVPAGYQTGVHMFGTDVASNLNNGLYIWNKEAKSVYVYFKRDHSLKTTGSNFTTGHMAMAVGFGFVFGALITSIGTIIPKKKKETE